MVSGWKRSRCLVLAVAASAALGAADAAVAQGAVAARESLRIDGSKEILDPVGSIAANARGEIAVLQQLDHTIRIFDARGKQLRVVGGDGSGPGEFEALSRAGWLGDTLWVIDSRLGRVTLFGPQHAKPVTFPTASRTQPLAGLVPAGPLLHMALLPGRATITLMFSRTSRAADAAEVNQYVRLDAAGVLKNVVAAMPEGDGMSVAVSGGGGTAYLQQPFDLAPLHAVVMDGRALAIVEAKLDGSSRGTFEVRMTGADGALLYARTHRFPAVALPKRVADSALAAGLDRVRGRPAAKELAAAYRKQVRIPSVYPPFTRILIGDDGKLWIEMREVAGGRPYMVLDQRGDIAATVMFPAGTAIHSARDATAWGVQLDEDDVPSIVKFSLPTSRRQSP